MIAFLEGVVEEKAPASVLLNVGGVGYELLIPLSTYDRLAAQGQTCRLLTHDYVREDQHLLFGFLAKTELRMFSMLLGINGVGPKIALSALSGLSVRELTAAVADGDVKRLSSISGVGKKMAERMVVELRDKIGDADVLAATTGGAEPTEHDLRTRDAVLALISLGYKQNAARKMVENVIKRRKGEELDVEDIIRKALAG